MLGQRKNPDDWASFVTNERKGFVNVTSFNPVSQLTIRVKRVERQSFVGNAGLVKDLLNQRLFESLFFGHGVIISEKEAKPLFSSITT
jgi:hypothetical protein